MRRGFTVLLVGMLSGLAALMAVLLKQKNEALDTAQVRIARLDQRLSQLATGGFVAEAEADLRAQLAQQTAEVERLRARVAALQQQTPRAAELEEKESIAPDASTSEGAVEPVATAETLPTRTASQISTGTEFWQQRFEAESGWHTKAPALAAVGRSLEKLSEAKLAFANQAAQTRVLPTVVEQPQDLALVDGIGAVYEQRLYNAGIGTYWELALLEDVSLHSALKLERQRGGAPDLDAIRASARQLALENDTVGYVWTGEAVDDFEPIKGIGKVYEQRLYDAGIRTYAALAQATPERLQEVCQSRSPIQPDFASWIAEAKKRMNA